MMMICKSEILIRNYWINIAYKLYYAYINNELKTISDKDNMHYQTFFNYHMHSQCADYILINIWKFQVL